MTHLRNPFPKQRDVFSSKMGMMREPHFQFINRLRGQPGQTNRPRTMQRVMNSFEPINTSLNAHSPAPPRLQSWSSPPAAAIPSTIRSFRSHRSCRQGANECWVLRTFFQSAFAFVKQALFIRNNFMPQLSRPRLSCGVGS